MQFSNGKSEEKSESVKSGTLPMRVDWREKMNPVRSQGHCGSCWTFATSALIEGHAAIYNNDRRVVLSTQ